MPQKEMPSGGGAGPGTGDKSHLLNNQFSFDCQTILFPFYRTHADTRPAKQMNLSDLVQWLQNPRIGPKETCPALTPFNGDGKTKEIAQASLYHSVLGDHDHDNQTAEGIRALYDPYNIAYIAWTTSSHQQDGKGNRWKVLIPFSDPCGFDLWVEIARGLALMTGADLAQARIQQISYGPNKLTDDAPYEYIICLDRPFVDPAEPFDPLINDCLKAYTKDLEAKKAQAAAALPKPRRLNGYDCDIIEKINLAYGMGEILEGSGQYIPKGKNRYLFTGSESGTPGLIFLNRDGKEVVFSHHGFTDPLSHQNNGGHALDVFDVLCKLQYGGDISRAIRDLAPQVDPDGQKQRQREFMENNSTAAADFSEFKTDDGEVQDFSLSMFSMFGQLKQMVDKMMNDVYIIHRLAIMGQSTVFFAQYNVGKTLMVIFFIIQAIRDGVVKGEDIYYINADDTFKGLVYKLKIAEKWGFHQLAPGHGPEGKEFKADQLPLYLNMMVQAGTASGKVVILDTVKKFTDLMSKDKSSKFNEHVRQFISHGGTVIMLAHVNKHRDENKKVIYEGTSDLVSDCDCAYTLDTVTEDIDGFRTIKFENIKSRGDVATEAFYKYDARNDLNYFDRLDSVTAIDDDERQQAEQRRAMENKLKKNRLAVDAIMDCIREGTTSKTELIATAAKNSGISKTKVTKALMDHTGPDVSKNQFWYVETGEHNAKNYRLNYGVEA
jgi:hypothetical protein